MKESLRKKVLLFLAAATLLVGGVAWAGITAGVLNNDQKDVDLSVAGSYRDGKPQNEITLGDSTVTLTHNLTLGNSDLAGYATNPNDPASTGNAGGAIFVDAGRVLNIMPGSGKTVQGEKNASLRLFGNGTTNLYNGSNNSYAHTFIQSGRLNIKQVEALGGSELTVGGGATVGLIDNSGTLDLTNAKALNFRRYDSATSVTIDTGSSATNSIMLPRIQEQTSLTSGVKNLSLVKKGLGTLILAGVTEHSGGTVIEAGTLEVRETPQAQQTVEVKTGATFASTVDSLLSLTLKPQAESSIKVPAIGSAVVQTTPNSTEKAAMTVTAIDTTSLSSGTFNINADLSAVRKPTGADADHYYVRLINSTTTHNLSEANVNIEDSLPSGFSTSYYVLRPHIDGNNICADISKDIAPTEAMTLDVRRSGSAATVTANLSDKMDGKVITFVLTDSKGASVATQNATSSNGVAAYQFTNLAYDTYTVKATASGYVQKSTTFVIDGSVDAESTMDVTVNEGSSSNMLNVILSSKSGAFPDGATFKYRFIETGGSTTSNATNLVSDSVVFTANNVEFNTSRTSARFTINLNSLSADDGKKYILAPGKTYRVRVEGSGDINGSSEAELSNGGIYTSQTQPILIAQANTSGTNIINANVAAQIGGVGQNNVLVTFRLVDNFGNIVNLDNSIAVSKNQFTDSAGKAQVQFTDIPAGYYMIQTTASGYRTDYSSEIDTRRKSGGSGGGGCDMGFGIIALLAAGAIVTRRHKR